MKSRLPHLGIIGMRECFQQVGKEPSHRIRLKRVRMESCRGNNKVVGRPSSPGARPLLRCRRAWSTSCDVMGGAGRWVGLRREREYEELADSQAVSQGVGGGGWGKREDVKLAASLSGGEGTPSGLLRICGGGREVSRLRIL